MGGGLTTILRRSGRFSAMICSLTASGVELISATATGISTVGGPLCFTAGPVGCSSLHPHTNQQKRIRKKIDWRRLPILIKFPRRKFTPGEPESLLESEYDRR